MKKIILRNPIISSLCIMFLAIGFTFLPLNISFLPMLNEQTADYISGFTLQTIISLFLVYILNKLELFEDAKFNISINKIWINWPMVLFILLLASNFLLGNVLIDTSKPDTVIMFILVYLSTGFFEEILYRGLIQTLFLKKWGHTTKGIYFSIIIPSILFGTCHLVHFFLGHASLLSTITQIIYASFIGIYFGACVLENNSIFPAIILHGLFDIAGSLNEIAIGGGINKNYRSTTPENAIFSILLMLPLMVYGLIVLRKYIKNSK